MRDPIAFLSIDDVLESHLFQVETYGGDSGLRDAGLLESAIAQPQASFGGEYLHAFPFEMAAGLPFPPCHESPIRGWQQASWIGNSTYLS